MDQLANLVSVFDLAMMARSKTLTTDQTNQKLCLAKSVSWTSWSSAVSVFDLAIIVRSKTLTALDQLTEFFYCIFEETTKIEIDQLAELVSVFDHRGGLGRKH